MLRGGMSVSFAILRHLYDSFVLFFPACLIAQSVMCCGHLTTRPSVETSQLVIRLSTERTTLPHLVQKCWESGSLLAIS